MLLRGEGISLADGIDRSHAVGNLVAGVQL